jgi:hypothetical protein
MLPNESSESLPSSESYTDHLDELQTTVTEMVNENARLRSTCDELAVHLRRRRKALHEHITRLEAAQKDLWAKNSLLVAEIERRKELIDQVESLDNSFRGSLSRGSNSDGLTDVVQSRSSAQTSPPRGTLDPIASQIVARHSIFGDCRTNRDFVLMVRQIVLQIEGGAGTSDSLVERRLRNKLTALEDNYRNRIATDAFTITALAGEIERTDKILEQNRARRDREDDITSGTPTHRKGRTAMSNSPPPWSRRPGATPQRPSRDMYGFLAGSKHYVPE